LSPRGESCGATLVRRITDPAAARGFGDGERGAAAARGRDGSEAFSAGAGFVIPP